MEYLTAQEALQNLAGPTTQRNIIVTAVLSGDRTDNETKSYCLTNAVTNTSISQQGEEQWRTDGLDGKHIKRHRHNNRYRSSQHGLATASGFSEKKASYHETNTKLKLRATDAQIHLDTITELLQTLTR